MVALAVGVAARASVTPEPTSSYFDAMSARIRRLSPGRLRQILAAGQQTFTITNGERSDPMAKWLHALQLGIEILADVEALLLGVGTSFTFAWHGRKFTVTINPQ